MEVHRHADGTADVLFKNVPIDKFTDDMVAASEDVEEQPPVDPANGTEEVPAEEASPVDVVDESAAPAEPYKCPQCGATFEEPTTCANSHPPAETVQLGAIPATSTGEEGDSGGGAAPGWPDHQPQD